MRTLVTVIAAITVAVSLAACGGDDDDTSASATTVADGADAAFCAGVNGVVTDDSKEARPGYLDQISSSAPAALTDAAASVVTVLRAEIDGDADLTSIEAPFEEAVEYCVGEGLFQLDRRGYLPPPTGTKVAG